MCVNGLKISTITTFNGAKIKKKIPSCDRRMI
jgi:hypothetical protein